jgi:FlaA1/EpsC-like NDP-sugar epimerase
MTRFSISLNEGVEMVRWALKNAIGGEIFVPKIPSYRIIDVATAIGPECEHPVVGIRPGEKIHEEMITVSDSSNTVDLGKYYAILSPSGQFKFERYCEQFNAMPVESGFSYNSGSNSVFLTIEQIQSLIREHVDPKFMA